MGANLIGQIDDFMSWLLFGHETWLVAVLKGVPLFLYIYFLIAYVPNYVYYGFTQYIPFLKFTPETGFIFAAAIVGGIGKIYGAMAGALLIGLAMEVSALYVPADYKVVVEELKRQGLWKG